VDAKVLLIIWASAITAGASELGDALRLAPCDSMLALFPSAFDVGPADSECPHFPFDLYNTSPCSPCSLSSDSAEELPHSSSPISIPPPPAALAMLVQGLVFMALVRGRSRWILFLAAIASVGRSSAQSIVTRMHKPPAVGRPQGRIVDRIDAVGISLLSEGTETRAKAVFGPIGLNSIASVHGAPTLTACTAPRTSATVKGCSEWPAIQCSSPPEHPLFSFSVLMARGTMSQLRTVPSSLFGRSPPTFSLTG